jgi:hypothetical protein
MVTFSIKELVIFREFGPKLNGKIYLLLLLSRAELIGFSH